MNAHATAAAAHTFTVLTPGDASPWGTIETVTYHADGITYVSTARHGGFHVDNSLLYRVPLRWRRVRHGETAREDSNWFGEDLDWAMVVLIFTDTFRIKARHIAKDLFDDQIAPKLRTQPY